MQKGRDKVDLDNFDKHFEQTKKMALAGMFISFVIGAGLLGFGVWVVLKLLTFFGVL
jgi:hypothetical protein